MIHEKPNSFQVSVSFSQNLPWGTCHCSCSDSGPTCCHLEFLLAFRTLFPPPTTTKSHAILPAFPSLQGAEQFLSSQSTVLPHLHSSTMVSMLGILSELYFSCLFSAVLTVPFLMVPHINFSIYQHLPFQPRTELRSPCQLGILIFLRIWAPVDNELELIFDLFEMWIYYFPHFLFLVLLPCSWNVSEPICPKLKSSTFQERFVDVFPFSFPK